MEEDKKDPVATVKHISEEHQGVFRRHVYLLVEWNTQSEEYKKYQDVISSHQFGFDIFSHGYVLPIGSYYRDEPCFMGHGLLHKNHRLMQQIDKKKGYTENDRQIDTIKARLTDLETELGLYAETDPYRIVQSVIDRTTKTLSTVQNLLDELKSMLQD